ncbi:MAG: type I glyceraldehyde-3-phosphate dehydrogenase [Arenicella sp.]|nr:type I glyceraldehyde-3-phosphate dehydrogenase [Arenicella sp.]
MIKIAINGFGRIGRNVLRIIYENNLHDQFEVVAINDLVPTEANAHLLQYDTTHGRFNAQCSADKESISVNGKSIAAFTERDPAKLPWGELEVDVVFECTGFFKQRDKAALHLQAGAKKVLVSAPGKKMDATVVYGVNHDALKPDHTIVSNSSCTTNCLAHVAKAMQDAVGIEQGLVNTIHAYTSTQNLVDAYHKDKRRARAAAYSMIPTTTGSAKSIGTVIPELDGKLDAVCVRVPTINVSLLDFTFTPGKAISQDDVEEIFREYGQGREGVFELCEQPLVSIDFNHHPASCVVDLEQTYICNNMVKVLAWYDNEWGYSYRMLDTATVMSS